MMRRLCVGVGLMVLVGCSGEVGVGSERVDVGAGDPKEVVVRTRDFAVPVLMYHRVDDLSAREAQSPLMRDLTVSPADFEAQVKYLKEQGFTFLTSDEVTRAVKEGGELPEKAVFGR